MKLSKRGWNNVLLVACVIMIYLFNTMSDKIVDNAEGEREPVLPAQSMVLTLEYPEVTIERLGRQWRAVPGAALPSQAIAPLVDGWQQLEGTVTTATSDEDGVRILLWLATEEHPRRLWLQPGARLLTDIQRQRSWLLDDAQTQLLLSATPTPE